MMVQIIQLDSFILSILLSLSLSPSSRCEEHALIAIAIITIIPP